MKQYYIIYQKWIGNSREDQECELRVVGVRDKGVEERIKMYEVTIKFTILNPLNKVEAFSQDDGGCPDEYIMEDDDPQLPESISDDGSIAK